MKSIIKTVDKKVIWIVAVVMALVLVRAASYDWDFSCVLANCVKLTF